MNLKLYGDAGQKKLAEYPDRIAKIQAMQSAIPSISELNLNETLKLRDRMQRYRMELTSYQVSMEVVLARYRLIMSEAEKDCQKMERTILSAPKDVDERRRFSLKTSIAQTEQQMIFVKQQCDSLSTQIENVKTAKKAISVALEQNKLANLADTLQAIKQYDEEIRK